MMRTMVKMKEGGVRCSPGAPGDDYTDGLRPKSHWMNFLTEISGSLYRHRDRILTTWIFN